MFADIVFPTAVRRVFTYQLPDSESADALIGKRVWAPLRNYFAIGVIVKVHDQAPEFETRPIRRVLDETPVISKELLELTQWIHQFYFCSWGEVIQAALPAGLNFVSRKMLDVAENLSNMALSIPEQELLGEFSGEKEWSLDEAKKRWKGMATNKVLTGLLKKGALEIWEKPDLKITPKTEKFWVWTNEDSPEKAVQFLAEVKKANKWQQALGGLAEESFPQKESALKKKELFTSYTLKKLEEEGWIRAEFHEVDANAFDLPFEPDSIKQLNEHQEQAFEPIAKSIEQEEFTNYLLYGITGSGKTEVYIHALKKIRELGKTGVVLVPEIALTPQTVARFYRIFGDEIAVLHSRMSARERMQAWKSLQNGEKSIAIGPRSAVFAPLKNLGLIILDEEHDASYKQMDPAPRYHAREVAIMRASRNNAVLIMGSATPSMQALNMAAKGKAELLEMNHRHAGAVLPEVNIIDLKEYSGAMRGPFSVALFQEMEAALARKEQIILLYNRRGFASYMQCADCGHIPESPDCSVSLTYHKRKNMLMCHYSGYSRRADTRCEFCGSENLMVQGSGTQKIEEDLEQWFPQARVLRFDKDSTSKKGAHEKILGAFARHEADILVGTQLVSKGLDFPNVTVVGVVDADTEQAFPSFASSERLYQLLSQVAGRSGRGSKPGKVFIQTRKADNPAIQFAKLHDHKAFSREEMGFRKELEYPPFMRLIRFVCKGKEEATVSKSAFLLRDVINVVLPDAEILGPTESVIPWMNRNFFWELTLKINPEKGGNFIETLLEKVMEIYEQNSGEGASTVRVNINVDAVR